MDIERTIDGWVEYGGSDVIFFNLFVMMFTLFMLSIQIPGALMGFTWSTVASVFLGGCFVLQSLMLLRRLSQK